jgi:hypothetical protein
MHTAARHLAFHASIVLLFGLLLGAPYARAIRRNAAAHITNSWRVAHQALPLGATLMFSVAASFLVLRAPEYILWFIVATLVVSAYAFCVSTCLAAITGQRGLGSGGVGLGKVVYLGNVIGALASVMAAVALVIAAFVSL